ncbi:MAG: dienelactone hydrolase family protein [Janthinobacterium lividum]
MPTIQLTSKDGHSFSAYQAGPQDTGPALVVVQEIFGVNSHIRRVCDRFAAAGFRVIAPALFDRATPGSELGYTEADVAKGLELRARVPEEKALLDIETAAATLGGAVGIVGYCWGGTLAWLGATRSSSFKAAVGWYGGGIAATCTETPRCPVQLHFGATDHGIPLADVDKIRAAQPAVDVFVYEGAGHGFGCDERGSYDAAAYDTAHARTLAFFEKALKAG